MEEGSLRKTRGIGNGEEEKVRWFEFLALDHSVRLSLGGTCLLCIDGDDGSSNYFASAYAY